MRMLDRYIITKCKRLNKLFNHPLKRKEDFLWDQDWLNYKEDFKWVQFDDFVRLLVSNTIDNNELGIIFNNEIIQYMLDNYSNQEFVRIMYNNPKSKLIARITLELRKYKLLRAL